MQLVKSLSREAAEELHIPTDALRRFRYLRRSGCTSIAGTDDVADFHLVQHAMDAVNIDKKAQVCRTEPSCCMLLTYPVCVRMLHCCPLCLVEERPSLEMKAVLWQQS